MHFTTLLSSLALLSSTGWAGYTLVDDYMSGNFFDEFSFWDSADPTNGFVSYQSRDSSESQNLIGGGTGGVASFGVNNKTNAPNGRESVRITSNKSYQSGLFIIDVAHMPGGICGTWPAFWMVGPDWPNQGEIDIIEGVNDQQANDMTLHTGPGCTIGGGNSGNSNSASFSGSLVSTNCVSGSGDNQGCQIATENTATYGTQFNQNGGGVYATEWTDQAISIYWFPRGSIPSDVTGDSPNPSGWGTPLAVFSGGCDMGTAFTNQQIVFDTTFCGDWAGQVWSGSTCAQSTGSQTCEDFVANNPEAFDDAYWTVNGLKVYQSDGSNSPAPSSGPGPSAAPSSAAPSSPPQPSQSGWGSGAPSGAPSGIPEISGTPGWPAPSGQPSGQPSASPSSPQSAAPAPSAAPSGQPSPVPEWSGRPQWSAQPSQTRGGHQPWHSGAWTENQNSDGSWSVGTPVQGSVVVEENVDKRDSTVMVDKRVERIHSRHLAKHRRSRHAGHGM